MFNRLNAAVALLAAALLPASAVAQTKLLRFPDIHGDRVVFCYARRHLDGARRRAAPPTRLTAHPGRRAVPEVLARRQVDRVHRPVRRRRAGLRHPGRRAASPKQLTFYPARGPLPPRCGYDNQVYGWTPDGKQVLFRSMRDADGVQRRRRALHRARRRAACRVPLPMPTVRARATSRPTASSIVYSPLFRDFRTWKRYEGGWAQDLYIFDLATARAHAGSRPRSAPSATRCGSADTIYFVSDRDGTLNLYAYDVATQATEQLTQSHDVGRALGRAPTTRAASSTSSAASCASTTSQREAGPRARDHRPGRRPARCGPSRVSADKNDRGLRRCRPKGERALFVARGDVFTAPIEKGPTRNLTDTSSAHDKCARWSPDGKRIAFVSDRSGEDADLPRRPGRRGRARAADDDGFAAMLLRAGVVAGRQAARLLATRTASCTSLTVADKKVAEVADDALRRRSATTPGRPTARYLAFSHGRPERHARSLHVWSVGRRQARTASPTSCSNERAPAWDPEGNYLYFLSDREFAPQISDARVELRRRTATTGDLRPRAAQGRASTRSRPRATR